MGWSGISISSWLPGRVEGREGMKGSLCKYQPASKAPCASRMSPRPTDFTLPLFTPPNSHSFPMILPHPPVGGLNPSTNDTHLGGSSGRSLVSISLCSLPLETRCRERLPAHSGSRRDACLSSAPLSCTHFLKRFLVAAEVAEVTWAMR